ncbi:MAG: DUF6468 domain-containing protein [Hyphomicrobiales bacterium]
MNLLPIVVEGAVAVLLLVTAGYCVFLERRISAFKADQQDLRSLVSELDRAVERAQASITGLGNTTREAEKALDDRLIEARVLTKTLTLASAPVRRRVSKKRVTNDQANGTRG